MTVKPILLGCAGPWQVSSMPFQNLKSLFHPNWIVFTWNFLKAVCFYNDAISKCVYIPYYTRDPNTSLAYLLHKRRDMVVLDLQPVPSQCWCDPLVTILICHFQAPRSIRRTVHDYIACYWISHFFSSWQHLITRQLSPVCNLLTVKRYEAGMCMNLFSFVIIV